MKKWLVRWNILLNGSESHRTLIFSHVMWSVDIKILCLLKAPGHRIFFIYKNQFLFHFPNILFLRNFPKQTSFQNYLCKLFFCSVRCFFPLKSKIDPSLLHESPSKQNYFFFFSILLTENVEGFNIIHRWTLWEYNIFFFFDWQYNFGCECWADLSMRQENAKTIFRSASPCRRRIKICKFKKEKQTDFVVDRLCIRIRSIKITAIV